MNAFAGIVSAVHHPSRKYLPAVYCLLACALFVRLIVESIWLLPSPVGDAALFLTASVNYCRSNFLGTSAFPIDPTGQLRMIWHGFVSPMLFGRFIPGCNASGFFVGLWFVKASTTVAILWLARLRNYSALAACGLAVFALAAQCQIGFRPESMGILLIVLAEISLEYARYGLMGAVMGALLCTQPTLAALHGLVMLATRFELVKHWLHIGLGYAFSVVLLLVLYPFPVLDLVSGIMLQAKVSVNRADAGLLSYYVVSPSLPAWGILFFCTWVCVAIRKPMVVVTLPALWFFGPRVPPTTYNVIPICLVLLVLAYQSWSGRTANLLGAASLLVGVLGLGLLTVRDALTIYTYGDTFRITRDEVERISGRGDTLVSFPPFLALTNSSMRLTDPNFKRAAVAVSRQTRVSIYEVNGRPKSPCAAAEGTGPKVSLSIGKSTVFNSNSGWMIYACREPN